MRPYHGRRACHHTRNTFDEPEQIVNAFLVLDVERRRRGSSVLKMPDDMPIVPSLDEQNLGRFVHAAPA